MTKISKILANLGSKCSKHQEYFIKNLIKEDIYGYLKEVSPDFLKASILHCYDILSTYQTHKDKCVVEISHQPEGSVAVINVVSQDKQFLVDSIANELKRHKADIIFISHPLFYLETDDKGKVTKLLSVEDSEKADKNPNTAVMQFFITNLYDEKFYAELEKKIYEIVSCVRMAVDDWKHMKDAMLYQSNYILQMDKQYFHNEREWRETHDFLIWLIENNFIFLGLYEASVKNNKWRLEKSKSKGVANFKLYDNSDDIIEMVTCIQNQGTMGIGKHVQRSIVHRDANMDAILIYKYDDKTGKPIGCSVFVGLFASSVFYHSIHKIPLIRYKVDRVAQRYSSTRDSFNAKELMAALEAFPREELLQIKEDELLVAAKSLISLSLRPRVKVFVRMDEGSKFLNFVIFIPKARFSTKMKEDVLRVIHRDCIGEITTLHTLVGEGELARLHIIMKIQEKVCKLDLSEMEGEVYAAISQWSDKFLIELKKHYSVRDGLKKYHYYKNILTNRYTNSTTPQEAVSDIKHLEELSADVPHKFLITGENYGQLKLYSYGKITPLSEIMPTLDNAGLHIGEVATYRFTVNEELTHYLTIFDISPQTEEIKFSAKNKLSLEELLVAAIEGKTEDDKLNSLVTILPCSYEEVLVFRSILAYMKQIKFSLNNGFVIETLCSEIAITRKLLELFHARFDNTKHNAEACHRLEKEIYELLQDVTSLAADRTLRFILQMMFAIKRTNYYQTTAEGLRKPYLSFKVASSELNDVPLPKPMFEVFVYSSRMEGIHARGGKIARGGLRLSDRHQDYRTELMGLLKAQMTKNAVIVPVGSKGAFIAKNAEYLPNEERALENVECYKTFLSGILDITDNIIKGKVKAPKDVVRHDEDDPYLVVAADKGTATFSDHANQVSQSYNFWLGDAFASGGSNGYDHKKMAITARGAWISVEKHFEYLGIDIKKEEFTVVGIGDMSGDVFGNGMLLSDNIKLIAAFNHLHIFFDPNPDAKLSFAERKRLFELPRSTWKDYNPELISKGGGVFSRSQKSIVLTEELKQFLNTKERSMTPDALIHAILQADVDLLWNGGIGTYIKGSTESHDQIGDKANDALRLNGNKVGAKVFGEGGNLGSTQLGRIEFYHNGGMVNTDFIDNSAGVDCSDHEVNIKIALSELIEKKQISLEERNKLLAKMADEVAELVLRDNLDQTLLLNNEQSRGGRRLKDHAWLISSLESRNELVRDIEYLPDEQKISILKAENKGLSRPSISVLISYAKNSIAKMLTEINFSKEEFFERVLLQYFPKLMREQYPQALRHHKLANEIVITIITNDIINKMGACYFHQVLEELSAEPQDIVLCYMFMKELFDIDKYWDLVEKTSDLNIEEKARLFRRLQVILGRNIRWMINSFDDIRDAMPKLQEYKKNLNILLDNFDELQVEIIAEHNIAALREELFTEHLWIDDLAKIRYLISAPDIINIADKTGIDVKTSGQEYFQIGRKMHINWLLDKAMYAEGSDHVEKMAIKALIARTHNIYSSLVINSLSLLHKSSAAKSKEGYEYCEVSPEHYKALNSFISSIKAAMPNSIIAMITIVLNKLEGFIK